MSIIYQILCWLLLKCLSYSYAGCSILIKGGTRIALNEKMKSMKRVIKKELNDEKGTGNKENEKKRVKTNCIK